MLELIFIRHGMTETNKKGCFAGVTDYPVIPEELANLKKIISEHPYPQVDAVFCSPLLRCRQTAKCIYPKHSIIEIRDLIEVDFGVFEGAYAPDIMRIMGASLFLNRDLSLTFSGGESLQNVLDRAISAVNQIIAQALERQYQTVAVVSHAMLIGTFLQYQADSVLSHEVLSCPNGFGISVEVDPDVWNQTKSVHFRDLLPKGADRGRSEDSPFFITAVE